MQNIARTLVMIVAVDAVQRDIRVCNLEADGRRAASAEHGDDAFMMIEDAVPDVIVPDRVRRRDVDVDTRAVDVHIGRLRKALTRHAGPDPLRTVRGAGYVPG